MRIMLSEDADDLNDADLRQAEESLNFEEFILSLRKSGRL